MSYRCKATELPEQSFGRVRLDEEKLDSLPLITRESRAPGTYVQYRHPRSIDGQNVLPQDLKLVYVGSAVASAKGSTWKTGQAHRISGGHLVRTELSNFTQLIANICYFFTDAHGEDEKSAAPIQSLLWHAQPERPRASNQAGL